MPNDSPKIFPRNLTARAHYSVPGNPVTTRPEDAAANCYPGLELDVRNFDRRFFPGLVFNFVARADTGVPYTQPSIYGAKLLDVDASQDADLLADTDLARNLLADLNGSKGSLLGSGLWYIDWIEQAGRRLRMYRIDEAGLEQPLDGLMVWRLVRGLEPLPLRLNLKGRDGAAGQVELSGWRRFFADRDTGVISNAFQPGELTQSLCSPWQHDFRDCACNYWASNHPDVVFGEVLPGETTLPDGKPEAPIRAQTRLDWLRRDRSRGLSAGALSTLPKNRVFQLDHYEINREWQNLSVVVGDTETSQDYTPAPRDDVVPFATPELLAAELRDTLGPLEMALAIEYLYARFSLLTAEEAHDVARKTGRWATMADDVTFVRQFLMLVAVSEMEHLRWVNKLLWELFNAGLVKDFSPVLHPAKCIPGKNTMRQRQLRPLTPTALADFIAVEHPSALIDGQYAKVVATLRDTSVYPPLLQQIAERIISDGVDHESKFVEIQTVLSRYAPDDSGLPYLRPIRLGTADEARDALLKFAVIVDTLREAYTNGAEGNAALSGACVMRARNAMTDLLAIGEMLAGSQGIGIPFWST